MRCSAASSCIAARRQTLVEVSGLPAQEGQLPPSRPHGLVAAERGGESQRHGLVTAARPERGGESHRLVARRLRRRHQQGRSVAAPPGLRGRVHHPARRGGASTSNPCGAEGVGRHSARRVRGWRREQQRRLVCHPQRPHLSTTGQCCLKRRRTQSKRTCPCSCPLPTHNMLGSGLYRLPC